MKNDTGDLAITLRLKASLAAKLRALAEEEGSPRTTIVRHAVAEYVARRPAVESVDAA